MKPITYVLRKMIHITGNILRAAQHLYLTLAGIKVGKNTMISLRAKIDVRRGKIIIGDNCHVTYGCVILSHDYTARILNKETGHEEGRVVIGNNVFIGVNSVILPNVTIGDNSIIGAGSVVTGDIPANVIALGNPARVVKSIP
ncbi:MAG: acyltransferase [Smithellaceae bacterium]|nr:acyltransferase [Smithellaceae bacterium]